MSIASQGRKVFDITFAKAQARYPVATGKIIKKVVAMTSSKKSHEEASTGRIAGVADANRAAGVPASTKVHLTRDNGVKAANIAAGIPGYTLAD